MIQNIKGRNIVEFGAGLTAAGGIILRCGSLLLDMGNGDTYVLLGNTNSGRSP